MGNTPHNPFCGGRTERRESTRFIYLECSCGWSGKFPNQRSRRGNYVYVGGKTPKKAASVAG
jgi:hypothetical protein